MKSHRSYEEMKFCIGLIIPKSEVGKITTVKLDQIIAEVSSVIDVRKYMINK